MCRHTLATVVLVPTKRGYQLRCSQCGLVGAERRGSPGKARAVLHRLIYSEEGKSQEHPASIRDPQ
jgi:uncharacterized Zn finger protein